MLLNGLHEISEETGMVLGFSPTNMHPAKCHHIDKLIYTSNTALTQPSSSGELVTCANLAHATLLQYKSRRRKLKV